MQTRLSVLEFFSGSGHGMGDRPAAADLSESSGESQVSSSSGKDMKARQGT